jgi:DNA modification methylase
MANNLDQYLEFLQSKINIAHKTGFDVHPEDIHSILFGHQKDQVIWALKGGCRALFNSFGLGKTMMQLELMRQCSIQTQLPTLIVCPLGVRHEFVRDGKKMQRGLQNIKYITNTDQLDQHLYYITNYERIRKGDIDPSKFGAVTFDEASILRGLSTETVDVIMSTFKQIPFRFVCTATPSPNRFLELTHYAEYLGIMDRGLCLTTFFQRDSTTAGNLTLLDRRKKEFWYWMSSWATFITKPSDLGYDDTGYDLPPIQIHHKLVKFDRDLVVDKFNGQTSFVAKKSDSLVDAAKEKRDSLTFRIDAMKQIIAENPHDNFIIWHHQEKERELIQKELGTDCRSVYGSQNYDERETNLLEFSEGKYKYLSTKPEIAGSGCNFQYHCHKAIFLGIDYKFNDFIQAVHRIYRFMQPQQVEIWVIFTDAEDDILKKLEFKWHNHTTLQNEMTDIIKSHGLNADIYKTQLQREFFENRQEFRGNNFHAINNDSTFELPRMASDSIHLVHTSIPFGNHYEYSENFNCFGHNASNEEFFKQMDFLIPEIYRVLQPGRIAAIHVKDRIRYSYQNGYGFTDIMPFSGDTERAFIKHGFALISRITITTDVVRENNQTYRLGYTEMCKDGTKMGAGLPEYLLLFRKPPSDKSNAYADTPVVKDKTAHSVGRWQIDAHDYWKSSGDTLFDTAALKKMDMPEIIKRWDILQENVPYNYGTHVELNNTLDSIGKLPRTFMALQPRSNNPEVWDDITRMQTLNSAQSRKNLVKHICPLQIDIVSRVIERYSMKGETVLDPFGGIMTVPVVAAEMERFGVGVELNESYWRDGCSHLKLTETKQNQLTLF